MSLLDIVLKNQYLLEKTLPEIDKFPMIILAKELDREFGHVIEDRDYYIVGGRGFAYTMCISIKKIVFTFVAHDITLHDKTVIYTNVYTNGMAPADDENYVSTDDIIKDTKYGRSTLFYKIHPAVPAWKGDLKLADVTRFINDTLGTPLQIPPKQKDEPWCNLL